MYYVTQEGLNYVDIPMNKCCLCSAVKDVGRFLPKIVENMTKIGSVFDEYVMIFFYDQSNDNTGEVLNMLKSQHSNMIVIDNPTPLGEGSPRTYRIAHARNSLLDTIRKSYSHYEYFVMMDADEICTHPVKVDTFKKYLYRKDWDALSFNKPFYYDLWALSMKHLIFSVWHFEQGNGHQIYIDAIGYLLETCPPDDLISVYSAFNGFSIYRTSKFIDSFYDGKPRLDLIPEFLLKQNIGTAGNIKPFHWDPHGPPQDCEHRSFHLYAVFKNEARVRISPEIIFPTDPEFP